MLTATIGVAVRPRFQVLPSGNSPASEAVIRDLYWETILKILHVSYSDSAGGAARASYRCFRAQADVGLDTYFLCRHKGLDDDRVITFSQTALARGFDRFGRPAIGGRIARWLGADTSLIPHSVNLLPSRLSRDRRIETFDLLNFHWMGADCLSIEDIGRIRKPLVWRFPDLWPMCGSEHYPDLQGGIGYTDGYQTKHGNERYSFANRMTWMRKSRAWTRPINVVATTRWLAERVSDSPIMKEWPVTVIPNALNTDVWRPVDRGVAKSIFGLPSDKKLLAFGAMGGGKDPRKGIDLLFSALNLLRGELRDTELLVFGQAAPRNAPEFGFPVHWLGHLSDDVSLRTLYSAADLMVVPSRQEAFGQTASEAHACGTPVVAFANTGVADIVSHRKTGWLARPNDAEDLAAGIRWALSDETVMKMLSLNARKSAVEKFSYSVVANQYKSLYEKILAKQ